MHKPDPMIHAYHLVARAHPFLYPLTNRNSCVDLWRRLHERFPNIAACVLMPNHLHLLVLTRHPNKATWDLGVELRAWTQKFHPHSQVWSAIPKAIVIPDFHHLKRQIRYVHLNPCRAGLASDPLQWEWSTHRDVTGCVTDPWPDLSILGQVYGVSQSCLGTAIHRHVSGDPSTAVGGTPMVQSPRLGELVSADHSIIMWAAAVARRQEVLIRRGKLRDLAVQTAHHLRLIPEPEKFRMSQKSWHRALTRQPNERSIDVVLKILADQRCRSGSPTPNVP